MNAATQALRDVSAGGTPLTIGMARDATGASRRIVVAFLEYLDNGGVTVRDEEARRFTNKENTKND